MFKVAIGLKGFFKLSDFLHEGIYFSKPKWSWPPSCGGDVDVRFWTKLRVVLRLRSMKNWVVSCEIWRLNGIGDERCLRDAVLATCKEEIDTKIIVIGRSAYEVSEITVEQLTHEPGWCLPETRGHAQGRWCQLKEAWGILSHIVCGSSQQLI